MLERYSPAVVGQALKHVDTPALCIDLLGVEDNMSRLSKLFTSCKTRNKTATIRPIVKAHKCSEIAKIQLKGDYTKGVCCAKVCEAEAMMSAGIRDIYMSNEIIGMRKLDRLCTSMLSASIKKLRCAADSEEGVRQLQEAASKYNVTFDILIEVSVGQDRCGVASASEALSLAKFISEQPNLSLIGIQGYQGAAQHIRSKSEMRTEIANVVRIVTEVKETLISQPGLVQNPDTFVITGAGSGTLEFELSSGVYTELQPGSYLFNDVDYSKNCNDTEKQEGDSRWKGSMFILSTVMSRTIKTGSPSWVVVDAGIKAHSIDSGPPRLYGDPSVKTVNGGDEHFRLLFSDPSKLPQIGDKVLLQPGHVDPTFNMHDHVVAFRCPKQLFSSAEILEENPVVESVWEIDGRGPGF
eukprot:TRINITY_DN3032_c2_g1_i1.p1 TRINITY_DN3032_c2_g1~~TRINITY_DN3032_c2_g1_i1.p1  ORF type:complete len:410 (+),score=85.65 TRINITY_DN3032_c2_g1_i1:50-1279(+)